MERFINILVVDNNAKNRNGIKEILLGKGNNVLLCNNKNEALEILNNKEIGIILINIDEKEVEGIDLLSELSKIKTPRDNYKLAITANASHGAKHVKGLNEGAVDFITTPFNPNIVKAKIEIFKSIYYKDNRIYQLLTNIFPEQVLVELDNYQKFSPKRIDNGVVMFTDFVDFSMKSRNINPIELLHILENYFIRFDEIIERYKLEKIKTIGDSYMAMAGVTENYPEPEIRACLAAIEIKNFMLTEQSIAKALGKDFWEIRIGIHSGPLVAGIIGTKKFSFDIWGDTVNIAKRAEEASKSGQITITESIVEKIKNHFHTEFIAETTIHKRGGKIPMYLLKSIVKDYAMIDDETAPSGLLRRKCGLPSMDFDNMRKDIINRLRSLLPDELVYHDLNHTLNVEKAARRFAKLEGLDKESILLLRTAVLYHDSGFILQYDHNEEFAIKLAKNNLPRFGYSKEQIDIISGIIEVTITNNQPVTLMQKIMCDADHDYLGRADYYNIVKRLRLEMQNYNIIQTEKEWTAFQLNFLENIHEYYTETAQNIRQIGKRIRIDELRNKLQSL